MAPLLSLQEFTVEFVKLKHFSGGNFKRWQKKLHFILESLNVVFVFTIPKPKKTKTKKQNKTVRPWNITRARKNESKTIIYAKVISTMRY